MELTIYVEEGCDGCERALEIARWLRERFPALTVAIVDVQRQDAPAPEDVFAVPTYLLDGRVVSLGNPEPEALERLLKQRFDGPGVTMGG